MLTIEGNSDYLIERSDMFQYFKSQYCVWNLDYHKRYLDLTGKLHDGKLSDDEYRRVITELEEEVRRKSLH